MDLVISQGEAKQKRPGLFEPKASFQAAAERALEISQIHAHTGSNTGDGCKKLQRLVSGPVRKIGAALLKTAVLMLGLLLPIFLTAPPAGADIFSYVDENGVRHFSNAPSSARYEYLAPEISKDQPSPYGSPDRFDPFIRAAARSYGLDFALVKAVVCVESNFNPAAVSKAGAVGLMQIMPANFTAFRLNDPYNPRANIMAGARYLKSLLERYKNNLKLSLAAYNAGPTAVERYNGVPPYAETQTYIKRVMGRYAEFKKSEGQS